MAESAAAFYKSQIGFLLKAPTAPPRAALPPLIPAGHAMPYIEGIMATVLQAAFRGLTSMSAGIPHARPIL